MSINSLDYNDVIDERCEDLKHFPFTLEALRDLAWSLIGDKKLQFKANKGQEMSFCIQTNTVYVPMKYLLDNPDNNRDGLVVLSALLRQVEGHYKNPPDVRVKVFVNGEALSKDCPVPANIGALLFQILDDIRINNILVKEKGYGKFVSYFYQNTWTFKSLAEVAGGVEKIPRYQQFIYNLFHFSRKGVFFDDTDKDVCEALMKREVLDSFQHLESFENVRDGIWPDFKRLVQMDLADLEDSADKGGFDWQNKNLPNSYQNTYYPRDMKEGGEFGNEKEKIVKYSFTPALKGNDRYCAQSVGDKFNQRGDLLWDLSTDFKDVLPQGINSSKIYTCKFDHPGSGKFIVLPMPRGFVVDTLSVPAGVKFRLGENGVYYVASDEGGVLEIKCGPADNKMEGPNIFHNENMNAGLSYLSKLEKLVVDLKNGSKGGFSRVKDLETYIKRNKSYSTAYQGSLRNNAFHASAIGTERAKIYFKMIDEAEEIECYTAATFGVALSRQVNVSARLVTGFYPDEAKDKSSLTTADGHAWVEVWDNFSKTWRIIDFTPPKRSEDKKNQQLIDGVEAVKQRFKEMKRYLNSREAAIDEDRDYSIKPVVNYSLPDPSVSQSAEFLSPEKLGQLYDAAMKVVDESVEEIINQLSFKDVHLKIQDQIRDLLKPKVKTYRNLDFGDSVGVDINSLINADLQGRACWELNIFNAEEPDDQIEMFDTEFVIGVDCSLSMCDLSSVNGGRFEAKFPLDSAFLQVLTLARVCAYFRIPFSVMLFADSVKLLDIKPEEWLDQFGELDREKMISNVVSGFDKRSSMVGGSNFANKEALDVAVKKLEQSRQKKKMVLLISDGDVTDQPFFDDKGDVEKRMVDKEVYLAALGLGPAKNVADTNKFFHRRLTFIESRFHRNFGEAAYGQMKGLPIGDFKHSTEAISQLLIDFIGATDVPKLLTDKNLPNYDKKKF